MSMWKLFNNARKEQERIQEQKDRLTFLVAEETMKMHSSYCPLIGGDCTSNCVHFKEGNVFRDWLFKGGDYDFETPSCKLWREG